MLLTGTSVQFATIEARKRVGFLAPKRRQVKYLDFVSLLGRDQGSEVQILSPRPSKNPLLTRGNRSHEKLQRI